MPFRYSDIKEPVWEEILKQVKSRAVGHGRRNGKNRRVLLRDLHDFVAEDIGIILLTDVLKRTAVSGVERGNSVEPARLLLGEAVSFSFVRDCMNDNRAVNLLGGLQGTLDFGYVMAVNGAVIRESHLGEEFTRNNNRTNRSLHLLKRLRKLSADCGTV